MTKEQDKGRSHLYRCGLVLAGWLAAVAVMAELTFPYQPTLPSMLALSKAGILRDFKVWACEVF